MDKTPDEQVARIIACCLVQVSSVWFGRETNIPRRRQSVVARECTVDKTDALEGKLFVDVPRKSDALTPDN